MNIGRILHLGVHAGRRASLFLGGCLLVWAGFMPSASAATTQYTLGVVPQFEQRKLYAIWTPVIDEINRRTGLDIRMVATLTIPNFEAGLEKGKYDFVYTNPYHIMRVYPTQGYIPLVRDEAALRGILVVRRDSPFKSLADLQGKTLAIPSPNALGAALLMRADLERLYGVYMKPVNVRTHSSVYLHVLNHLTDAGGGVQKTLAEQPPEVRDNLRVLYTTRAMPSHPIAAHPRVPAEVRERVKQAILDMAATPEGKALLSKIPMPNPVPASIDDYLVMRKWGLDSYWVEEKE